jgi:oligoribonuclease NrnB/cAMP/cGMP phosphodiesterase (DHH superfamily)
MDTILNASPISDNTISIDDIPNFRVDYLYGIHFTHNDGDGIGCAIVTDWMCMEPRIIMKSCLPVFCDISNVNTEIRKFLENVIIALHYKHPWDEMLDKLCASLNISDPLPTIPEVKNYFREECQTSFEDRPLYSSYEIANMGDYAKSQHKRVADYVYMSKFEFDSIAFQVNKESKFFHQTSIPGYVFISDVTLNEENAVLLDMLRKNYGLDVTYVDHHASNPFPRVNRNHRREEYVWASVSETDPYSGNKESACYQLLHQMTINHHINVRDLYNPVLLTNTIRCASLYDTWEWRNRVKDNSRAPDGKFWVPDTNKLCEKAPILEAIIAAYGIKMLPSNHEVKYKHLLEMFYDLRIALFTATPTIPDYSHLDDERFTTEAFYVPCKNSREADGPIYLDDIPQYKAILEEYYRKMEYTALKAKSNAVYLSGKDLDMNIPENANCAIIVLPEEFSNSAMEGVYNGAEQPVDIVLGLYPTSNIISFRRGTTNIDLGELARDHFNGGGHPDAAGGRLSREEMLKLMQIYIYNHFKE